MWLILNRIMTLSFSYTGNFITPRVVKLDVMWICITWLNFLSPILNTFELQESAYWLLVLQNNDPEEQIGELIWYLIEYFESSMVLKSYYFIFEYI